MTSEERAENAEAMLTGRVCARCCWRFPAQMHAQNVKGKGRKALLCGDPAAPVLHREIEPTESCERFAEYDPASFDPKGGCV